jgi:hypothetical protein
MIVVKLIFIWARVDCNTRQELLVDYLADLEKELEERATAYSHLLRCCLADVQADLWVQVIEEEAELKLLPKRTNI